MCRTLRSRMQEDFLTSLFVKDRKGPAACVGPWSAAALVKSGPPGMDCVESRLVFKRMAAATDKIASYDCLNDAHSCP